MKFSLYDRVRIKEGCMPLTGNLKPGDIGMIEDVTYHPMGWYKVSFDKVGNFRLSMRPEEIEKV